eukprot:TRINITY_DN10398_c0_g1_i1.p1 TRINITY_DN10398_c0_g1~~TRINITY_DN10398_c0_g1_i1.p1  ORF type:complete len:282 (-),score=26.26 TRINITY_DN10398_c0_g1_i1:135-980(-)
MKQYNLQYEVDFSKLSPAVQAAWLPLNFDEESREFVDNSLANPWSERWCSWRGWLAKWVGRYNADGVLNMSDMFVLSRTAWTQILDQVQAPKGRLIDVGAGDGRPTREMAPLFEHVCVTEASIPLSWRLWARGYRTVRTCSLRDSNLCDGSYDVVSCLNVLDRCDDPWQLLEELKACCRPDGVVVLAVVMPFCPTVLDGGQYRSPRVQLHGIPGCNDKGPNRWERCVNALVDRVFEVAGFELVSISRVPYMSHGDSRCGLYTLDDAIFVLRPVAVLSLIHI